MMSDHDIMWSYFYVCFWGENNHLEQILYTILNLSKRFIIFTTNCYAVFVLDDYSMYIMLGIMEDLLKRGYTPVIIGGGVTGDKQVNSTDSHVPLKAKYRELTRKRRPSQH